MADHADKRSQLIILACLDPVELGVMKRFPRHLTLVPWFSLPLGDIDGLKNELASAAGHIRPVALTGGDATDFGESGEARVRLLKDVTAVKLAHLSLLNLVKNFGGRLRSDQYCGDSYVPHVTRQEDGWLERNESWTLRRLQLGQAIESAHGKRRIAADFPLGE